MAKPKPKAAQRNGEATKPTERQAAYFMSLSLENVRCFGPKQTLDLSDGNGKPAPWTIILGLNGTGKTTVLQSMVGFEELVEPGFPSDPVFRSARFIKYFRSDHQYFCRSKGLKNLWSTKIAVTASLEDAPSEVVNWGVTSSETMISYNFPSGSSHRIDPPWCCAYGAGRRLGMVSLNQSEADDTTATLFSDKADLRDAEEWLLQLDYSAKASAEQVRQQQRLDQVKQLMLEILPEVDDIRLAAGTGPVPKAWAEFKTPYGWVPLRRLGYGYQTLIAWMVDFASRLIERYPDSKNPLAEPAVVLVDEIDLHLHPKWQRELMTVLTKRFPNTQFIATAHSPLVAQAAADANLAVLRREGDHVVIDNDVDNIRNWRIDQILTSDLFGLETARPPQIEKLLMERKKLLTKPKQTEADKRRLLEIEEEVGELPFGETAQERKEHAVIQKTLDLLMKERQPSP